MTDFLFPSDRDRAENDDLNRACEEVENLTGENDVLREKLAQREERYGELAAIFRDKIVGEQAAYIEWQHGKGADAGMQWIANGLGGPGFIPDENEPWGTEAQAYYDANKSDPLPACPCGRPSNQFWMGNGACCDGHMAKIRAEKEGIKQ